MERAVMPDRSLTEAVDSLTSRKRHGAARAWPARSRLEIDARK